MQTCSVLAYRANLAYIACDIKRVAFDLSFWSLYIFKQLICLISNVRTVYIIYSKRMFGFKIIGVVDNSAKRPTTKHILLTVWRAQYPNVLLLTAWIAQGPKILSLTVWRAQKPYYSYWQWQEPKASTYYSWQCEEPKNQIYYYWQCAEPAIQYVLLFTVPKTQPCYY